MAEPGLPESAISTGQVEDVESPKPPQQEAKIVPENKEASPKKGVATKLAESQRLLGEAQEAAKKEFDLQRSQFYDWVGKKSSEMPIVDETDRTVTREAVWHAEGEKSKRITLEESKNHGHFEGLDIADVEQPAYELSVREHAINLQGGGFDQHVAYNYPLQAMQYSYEKTTREPVSVDQTPDIFSYSKGVLDFLNKAIMQPATPSQPASDQPTVPTV